MVVRPSPSKLIPNPFLRKTRKCPNSPYKTKWHHLFNQQQALQTFIKTTHQLNNPTLLLNSLTNSFNLYNCSPTPTAYLYIIKTLTQKSHFKELNFILSHLQKSESFDTPERLFVDLIKVYGDNGLFNEAICLFFRIPEFRCVPTVESLNALLLVLCRSREFLRIVPFLLVKSRDMNVRIDESCFFILVSALCRIGEVGFALKLVRFMIDDEFCPDERFYSVILASLCKQKGGGSESKFDVMGVFEEMKMVGFRPGREDFRNVIRFLGKEGKGREAFGVLCEMKRERIKPDIVCYRMVLYGFVEEGEFSRAEELFDEALVFGLVPDVRTYNVYLKGLCKQKRAEDAYKMISCMEELGCVPDSVTFSTVLEGFCKVGDLDRAREVWREMKRKGIVINRQAYGIMIDAFVARGEVMEACNWLEEMLSRSSAPLPSTLDLIVCGLCHEGLTLEALHTIEKVSNHGVTPGFKSWEPLLLGLKLNLDHVKVLLASLVDSHGE